MAWECHKPKSVQPALHAKPVRKAADRAAPKNAHRAGAGRAIRQDARRPVARAKATNLTAPPGECPYCDRRRAHIRAKVATMRAAKKETKDAP